MKQLLILTLWLFVCSAAMAQVTIPEGTRLRARLEEDLSSASAQGGQSVRLSIVDELKIGDTVVIAASAPVTGRITEAVPKRLTKSGKLDFSADRVTAADGEKILLRYNREKDPSSAQSGVIGAGATIILGPAGMLVSMMRAKDIILKSGTIVELFTDEAHTFRPSIPAVAAVKPEEPKPEPPVEVAEITVTSTPDGAKVTVDGIGVGDTPASFQLKKGEHEIQIEKQGFVVWQQKLDAKAGVPANVEARLEKSAVKPAAKPAPKVAAKRATVPAAKPAAKAPLPGSPNK